MPIDLIRVPQLNAMMTVQSLSNGYAVIGPMSKRAMYLP